MATNIVGELASGVVVHSPGDFFVELRQELKRSLAPELRGFRTIRGRGRLMKIHFGEPAFHYEVWHHTGAGRLEVGLHFESTPPRNQAGFDFFRGRMVEVKASLPRAELEPWDRGWRRLYETIPAARLDGAVLDATCVLLVAYISALQPLLRQFLDL